MKLHVLVAKKFGAVGAPCETDLNLSLDVRHVGTCRSPSRDADATGSLWVKCVAIIDDNVERWK